MTSILEFNARASLCRQFAKLEPESRHFWLAEAERWLRLMREDQCDPRQERVETSLPDEQAAS
jgi:hypothetical protein